jgi:1-deoxy-D-xylulose-5-phosphate reductoisomerase
VKTVAILGATGSVGTSTLDIVERHRDRYCVTALTAASNVEALASAALRTGASLAVVADDSRYAELKSLLSGSDCRAASGRDALCEAASGEAEWVMAAIVGCAGLEPVMAAVSAGKTVALANKEALVTAGGLMTEAANRSGAVILPVDSEHNAIFQCLGSRNCDNVRRLVLTASGGPFRTWSAADMYNATPQQAVAHPNWSMGAKISVDSATMMNKGLELIEAHHLFGLPSDRIDIMVHPQSVVHSMVEFIDGSVLAQMGSPDMRIPIAHTLAYPERVESGAERLDLVHVGHLAFEEPDEERFPALRLARQALEAGGSAPIVLNAANEIAVAAFLGGRIRFGEIAAMAEDALTNKPSEIPATIDDVIAIDASTRRHAQSSLEGTAA